MSHTPFVTAKDPDLAQLLARENARQFYTAKLIPSENYASNAVMEATGSVLCNKYSEGYPRKRYYEGQQFIDPIEELTIDRAKALFGADHANVQPYSGSPANLAAYVALIKKKNENKRILALSLSEGGHLTHGHKVSVTSRFFEAHHYTVDRDTHVLDYDAVRERALEVMPSVIVCGATCYPREIDFARFRAIADEVGAKLLADIAHIAGLVAGGSHPSPVPYADVVTTTTHKTLRGPRGGLILCKQKMARSVDRAVFPGLQGGPHNNTIAALAVALKEAAQPEFQAYAHQIVVNSRALADALLAGGVRVITGGSDNHLVLFDATTLDATGKEAAVAMDIAGLEANANTVPFDPRSPMDPSGVRLGTPALTSRGMGPDEMKLIGEWICQSVRSRSDMPELIRIREQVRDLMAAFPAPGFESGVPARSLLD
ncbi:MAG: serine hydroxymethyltransferase [Myxococcales bacterium]|nr:serine hydroxymethyltransferase [Myxococcales bacterium]